MSSCFTRVAVVVFISWNLKLTPQNIIITIVLT